MHTRAVDFSSNGLFSFHFTQHSPYYYVVLVFWVSYIFKYFTCWMQNNALLQSSNKQGICLLSLHQSLKFQRILSRTLWYRVSCGQTGHLLKPAISHLSIINCFAIFCLSLINFLTDTYIFWQLYSTKVNTFTFICASCFIISTQNRQKRYVCPPFLWVALISSSLIVKVVTLMLWKFSLQSFHLKIANKQEDCMQINLRCSAQIFTTWWGGRFELW